MKNYVERMERRPGKFLGIFFILVWTGILAGGMLKQQDMLKTLEKQCAECMVQMGFSQIDLVRYRQKTASDDNKKQAFAASSLLTYMSRYMDSLTQKNTREASELAEIFPGQYAKNCLWSGAARDHQIAEELFYKTDTIVAAEEDKEKEKKEDTAENGEQDEQSKEDAEKIKLFDNGSADITEQNGKSKETNATVKQETSDVAAVLQSNMEKIRTLQNSKSRSYLLKNFYITDSSTSIDNQVFNVSKLLNRSMKLKKKKEPQILIFHTHGASEAFADSKKGKKSESIVGVGEHLAKILSEKYGYHVIHDETEYDKMNGRIDRNKAYNQSYEGVSRILQKHPEIQVVIDLHRDGVGNKVHRLTTIDGKKTAQVMFFNGLSRNASGNIEYLKNDNLQANLAFSLQMKIACMKNYKDFAKPIYLKGYRYNMHLRERYLLVELGNENNTLQEAKNAMPPLAKVLNQVLTK